MGKAILFVIGLGIAALLLILARRFRQAVTARADARAALFSAIAPYLAAVRAQVLPSGFPRMAGDRAGRPFDLQAMPDTLTFRKLPALWLMVTLTAPQPLRGEVRLMARPTGQEPFSTWGTLPVEVPLPPEFPPDVALRATAAGDLPAAARLLDLAPLFDDPAVKEVVLSQRGLRIVLLAEEAPRTAYLLYRDAELGTAPLAAGPALLAMDALVTLEKALADDR